MADKELKHVEHVCDICGKPLSDEDSVERGIGPVCLKHAEFEAEIQARLVSLQVDTPPEDYIPLETALQLCSDMGIPHGRLVKAMGGDRVVEEPMGPNFIPVYVGKRRFRWLPAGVLAEIPELLTKGSDAPRKKKATKKKPPKVHTLKAESGKFESGPSILTEMFAPITTGKLPRQEKLYEVQEDYAGFAVADLVTLKEFKAKIKADSGIAIQLTRTTKDGATAYKDANGLVVLKTID